MKRTLFINFMFWFILKHLGPQSLELYDFKNARLLILTHCSIERAHNITIADTEYTSTVAYKIQVQLYTRY